MRYGVLTGLVACALLLGACGVRGDLEPPPQAAVIADAPADTPADVSGTGEVGRKPGRRFILDPLL